MEGERERERERERVRDEDENEGKGRDREGGGGDAEKTGTEENISQLRDKEETESLIYHPGSERLHVYAPPWSRMFVCMLGHPATDGFQ
ncbi:hypothetical protein EYF80_025979 [Liparis tanakae]|uniref:Uncharacterized protein n=1 Tax=Liparis tanakae TaxID=230148 RepID=A0A4Z2HD22_9TELE|nr:hypothetical protein EYF80_025979 [Liparis tanakae]